MSFRHFDFQYVHNTRYQNILQMKFDYIFQKHKLIKRPKLDEIS